MFVVVVVCVSCVIVHCCCYFFGYHLASNSICVCICLGCRRLSNAKVPSSITVLNARAMPNAKRLVPLAPNTELVYATRDTELVMEGLLTAHLQ